MYNFTIIVLLLLLWVNNSFAQEISIQFIKEKFQSFKYEEVISSSKKLLKSKEKLNNDELIDLYTMKAVSHYTLTEIDSARGDFIEILKINNDYQLDPIKISPKIISFYNSIKQDYKRIITNQEELAASDTTATKLTEPNILQLEKNVFTNSIQRSLVLPGWGHLYMGSNTKGWILSSAGVLTLGSMVYYIFRTNSKEKDYLNETEAHLINQKYDEYNTSFKIRNALIISYAIIWIYTQIEILLFSDDLFSQKINSLILTDFKRKNSPYIELSFKIKL